MPDPHRGLVYVVLCLVGAACGSTDVQLLRDAYDPQPADTPIAVYAEPREVPRPFVRVANLTVTADEDPDPIRGLLVNDPISRLVGRTRQLGGDAVLVLDEREHIVPVHGIRPLGDEGEFPLERMHRRQVTQTAVAIRFVDEGHPEAEFPPGYLPRERALPAAVDAEGDGARSR